MAADLTQAYTALRNADTAGDTGAAQQLASYIKAQSAGPAPAAPVQAPPDTIKLGFTRNAQLDTHIPMPQGLGNFLGGVGEAFDNLGQGIQQDIGLKSRADIQNWRDLQALMPKSGARTAGNVTGDIAAMLPAAFIPGVNTLAGGAALGAASGLLQPSTSTGETVGNVIGGAAAAPAGLLAGRAVNAVGHGVMAATEPLLAGGQRRVAARTLQSFAGSPQIAGQAASILDNFAPKATGGSLTQIPGVLPGVAPTTAELSNNAGLAQLERSLRNNPELMSSFNERDALNRGAMTTAVNSVAGTPEARAAAVTARSAESKPLYDAAKTATVQADDDLRGILGRPSMQSAWARAQKLASENGDQLVSGKDVPEQVLNSPVLDADGKPFQVTVPAESARYSGKAIQYLKMALNDIADSGPQNGMGAHEARAVKGTLSDLNDWTKANLPALRAADQSYQALSRPINQMDVGQELRNRLIPALGDFGNNTRLNAASFTNALRNGDAMASNVLGRNSTNLADVLSPQQMQSLTQVGQQLGRRANAQELGRAAGSNTAQNLVSQNLIRQILGPLGLPQSLAERAAQSSLGQTVMRPAQWALRAGEGPILGHLGQAALDPQYAAGLLRMIPKAQRSLITGGLLAPIGAGTSNSIQK